jgi:integrase/recombinase XerD
MLIQHVLSEMFLAKDYTPSSLRRRREIFKDFMDWCARQGVTDLSELTRPLVRRFVADVRERRNKVTGNRLSSETQHTHASYVRAFLRFCADEGWLDNEVVRKFEMPRLEKRVIQLLTRKHYDLLRAATDSAFLESLRSRDKAFLSLMIDAGLRGPEVCTLKLDSLFLAPHESYVRVDGKGRKQREIGLGRDSRLTIHRYVTRARPKSELPYVFLSRDGKMLSTNAIDQTLHRLKREAGPEHFKGIRVSAHTLRHSFAVHFMEQGGDIYKLSRLLGHENITTTERYLRAFQARDARLTSKSVLDNL